MGDINAIKIPVFIINLKSRPDRRENILKEFAGRDEFRVTIVEAREHEIGTVSLWNTIKYILQNLADNNDEYLIMCEDDHQFTDDYSQKLLLDNIKRAMEQNADILLGGPSWVSAAVQISDSLFWVQNFSGLQFTLIFRKFSRFILQAEFSNNDIADFKISGLSENIFTIYPYISTQKEFGYSDVTPNNNEKGRVDKLFARSTACFKNLVDAKLFYKNVRKRNDLEIDSSDYQNIAISTYVISLPERVERREHIKQQFSEKKEFDVIIFDGIRNKIGALGLWQTMRKIVASASANGDDVIIICEDDHEFTEHYSRDFLLKNIFEAHDEGADILSGGVGYFSQAVPLTKNRFWIDAFYCTQFIVLYRKVFQKILSEPFDENVTADGLLSVITSNKMVLFPFISIQREFGYSDVTERNNEEPGLITRRFNETRDRLEMIQRVHDRSLKIPAEYNLFEI